MALSQENIYRLLPAIHRLRDEEGDGALKALISVIAEQAGVSSSEIRRGKILARSGVKFARSRKSFQSM